MVGKDRQGHNRQQFGRSTGSVLLRSPSDSAKRRARRGLMTLISTWRCACKVQRQIQTVIPTGLQADPHSSATAEQVGDQGLAARARWAKYRAEKEQKPKRIT